MLKSFKFAFEGIINTIKKERNLKIQILIMICVVILGFLVELTVFEWIICAIFFGIVISAELFNTAIEKTLDYANEKNEKNETIKFAKDASAGAVLVTAIHQQL